jgi:hypothetical protein
MPRTAATSKPEALANAAKFTAPPISIAGPASNLNGTRNKLISNNYLSAGVFCRRLLRTGAASD